MSAAERVALRALLLPPDGALPAGFLPHGPGAFVPVRRELAEALPGLLDAADERDRLDALLFNVTGHLDASLDAGTHFDEHLDAAHRALQDDEPVTL